MVDLGSVAVRKERLQQAFEDLDRERELLSRFVIQWKELDELFNEAERSVKKRYDDLDLKERAFQEKSKQLQDALEEREKQIEQKEQQLSARSKKPPAEAVVEQQQQQLRQTRDSAEQQQHGLKQVKKEPQEEEAVAPNSSMDLDLNLPQPSPVEAAEVSPSREMVLFGGGEDEKVFVGGSSSSAEVSVRPELKALCESMDGDGLRQFIVDHRKEVAVLRDEIPRALKCAADPASMVLTALEAYHPESCGHSRKETEASANRRACILLLECLQVALADPVLGVNHPLVPSHAKEVAKELAEKWRMDIQRDAAAAGSYLDAQAFLQLLATFGNASEFDEEELCRLISAIARRKQTPALCRAIGLSAKIPDIVDKLVEEGKQIEALSFANEFGIMDRIQPVLLLKNYLKEARKVAQSMLKSGHSSAAAQNDSMMKELSALKSVLKCIEEYKLEADYPSSPLQKRISTIEKSKLDRKRTGGSVKGQSKRPRGSNNGGGYSYRNSDRNSERGQYVGGGSVPGYQFVSPVAFERQSQGAYIPSYAPPNRNAVSLSTLPPNSYLYSTADGSIYGTGYTTAPSTSYANYANLRNALPPPPPAYQASFMH